MTTMIKHTLISFAAFLFFISKMGAQNINWTKLDSAKHIGRIHGGLEYGVIYGLQYGKILKAKRSTWIPFANVSLPLGKNIADDYKINIGTAANILSFNRWILSFDLSITNRQNKNPFVRMQSLGSESGIHFGYYRQKWFVNIDVSTDNSLITHLKHTDAYKGNYHKVVDGWYQNTSSNFSLGCNTGLSFKRSDVTLSIGGLFTQNLKTRPMLPFYSQLGYNYRFGK
jgi:hypothetical protein